MVYLLSALIILMAIIGTGTVSVVNLFRQEAQQVNSTYIRQHLDEVAQAIIENTRTNFDSTGYGFYPPAAETLSGIGYSTAPTWLTLSGRTLQGTAFLYCPFSNITSGTKLQTVTSSNSTTYAVATTALYTGAQRKFVTLSDAAPANASDAIAIIVAPLNGASTPPSCLNIDSNGQIAGAYVRIITRKDIWQRNLRISQAGERLYASPSATGDSSGKTTDNRLTLAQVLNYLALHEPQHLRLEFATGTYTVTGNSSFGSDNLLNTGTEWIGADSSTAFTNSANYTFTVNNKGYFNQINTLSNSTNTLTIAQSLATGALWFGDIHPSIAYSVGGGPVYYGGNLYTGDFNTGGVGIQQALGGDRTFFDGTLQMECQAFNIRRGVFTANSQANLYWKDFPNCGSTKHSLLGTNGDQVYFNGSMTGIYTNGTTISTSAFNNSIFNPVSANNYICGGTYNAGNTLGVAQGRSGMRIYAGCGATFTGLNYSTALIWGEQGSRGLGLDGVTMSVDNSVTNGNGPRFLGAVISYAYGGTDAGWPSSTITIKNSFCWPPSSTSIFVNSSLASGNNASRPAYPGSYAASIWNYLYNRGNWVCNRP